MAKLTLHQDDGTVVEWDNLTIETTRRICAADELYEALCGFNVSEDMVVSGTANTLILQVPLNAIRQAAAALAKARGETP